jgi:phage recombination protein Bet
MAMMEDVPHAVPETSLVVRTAQRYGIDPGKLLNTLKATAFKTEKPASTEQLMALLIVAERHRLDPFTRQIYAYPDRHGGIVPVVGVDGWLAIINMHPMFDGMETTWDNAEGSMTCTIWRKDRSHPIVVTEYLAECRRNTEPWKMIHRMMRHKATMQCARYAFGFSGIFDEEEADDIARGMVPRTVSPPTPAPSNAQRFQAAWGSTDIEDVPTDKLPPDVDQPRGDHTTEPTPPSLEAFAAQVERATDTFESEMIIEEAREFLNDEDIRELCALHARRFEGAEQ